MRFDLFAMCVVAFISVYDCVRHPDEYDYYYDFVPNQISGKRAPDCNESKSGTRPADDSTTPLPYYFDKPI